MGICWYCYWGWPKVVADIYEEARRLLGGDTSALHFGPAHIVWEDENWHSAEWCLEHFDENASRLDEEEKAIVRDSLVKLAAIPLSERDVCPKEYHDDDEHPELYPPPVNIVMVQR